MTVDETEVVARLLRDRTGRSHVMLDVGAHFGTSASYFDALGWTIYCFEPDPNNRAKLTQRFGTNPNVTIDVRAVSDRPAKGVTFFQSDESTGISGLHAFRDTHRAAGEVDVTTVGEAAQGLGLDRVDFLKIDVEGFDFSVLKGVPWDRLRPDAIECEFEDRKTLPLGYTYKDMAQFLLGKGYSVYLSEWHPIIRYGIRHDWFRLVKFPGVELAPDAWGNIIAFKVDPGLHTISQAFGEAIGAKNPSFKNDHLSSPFNQNESGATFATSKQSEPTSVDAEAQDTANRRTNPVSNETETTITAAAPKPRETHQQNSSEQAAAAASGPGARMAAASNYERFVLWAREKSPLAYHAGRLAMWVLRVSRRHAGMTFALTAILAALVLGGHSMPYGPSAIVLWALAAMLATGCLIIAGGGYVRHLVRQERDAMRAQARNAKRSMEALNSKLDRIQKNSDATKSRLNTIQQEFTRKTTESVALSNSLLKNLERATKERIDHLEKDLLKNLERATKERIDHLEKDLLGTANNGSDTSTRLRGMELELRNTVRNLEVRNRADGTKLRAEMQKQRNAMQKAVGFNSVFFQQFSRTLDKEDIQAFRSNWAGSLGLELKEARVGYLAHRACLLENKMRGRLATTIETIVLRSLVAMAVKRKDISILEIGTLFGIGAAAVYEAATDATETVHLTVIDPLDGYYGPGTPDLLTGARVDEKTLRQNWSQAPIPEESYTIIKHFTTDSAAIEAAKRRQYDVLIIDGDHSFGGVKFDFENYGPMVRPGGYIMFDDYDVQDWPDIKVYVDAEINPRDDLTFVGAGFRTAVFQVKRTIHIEAGAPNGKQSS